MDNNNKLYEIAFTLHEVAKLSGRKFNSQEEVEAHIALEYPDLTDDEQFRVLELMAMIRSPLAYLSGLRLKRKGADEKV